METTTRGAMAAPSARDIVLEQRRQRLLQNSEKNSTPSPSNHVVAPSLAQSNQQPPTLDPAFSDLAASAQNNARWVRKHSAKLSELYKQKLSPGLQFQSQFSQYSASPDSMSGSENDTSEASDHSENNLPAQFERSMSTTGSNSAQSAKPTPKYQASKPSLQQQMMMSQIPLNSSTSSMGHDVKSESPDDDLMESRRQFHLACEQTRRRNIKDGLEDLKNQIPSCENQKLTKAVILSKAVSYLQHTKRQKDLLSMEVARLRQELQQVRSTCNCGAAHACAAAPLPLLVPVSVPATDASQNEREYRSIQPKSSSTPATPSATTPMSFSTTSSFQNTSLRAPTATVGIVQNPASSMSYVSQQSSSAPTQVLPRMFTSGPSNALPPKSSTDPSAWLAPFQSRRASTHDDSMPLPSGWDRVLLPEGKILYVNKHLQTSSWTHPGLGYRPLGHALGGSPLPAGWEAAQTAEGLVFYIDHNNKTTTWIDPRPDSTDWTNGGIPYVNANSSLLNISEDYFNHCHNMPVDSDEGYSSRETSLARSDGAFLENIPPYGSLFV